MRLRRAFDFLSFSLRRSTCAALLCGTAAAGAQAVKDDDVIDLMLGPAYRTFVYEGITLREDALEKTRRAMLLGRCAVYQENRDFPSQPAPQMAAVMESSWRWAVRGGADGIPGDRTRLLARSAAVLLNGSFSSAQLQDWNRFRATERGARGLAVSAFLSALSLLEREKVTDRNTGALVGWPLATLRHMADDLHLRPAFDAAFDELRPGTARQISQFSEVMGTGPQPDEALARLLDDEGETLIAAFEKRLSKDDRVAVLALASQPVRRRWEKIVGDYRKLMSAEAKLLSQRPQPSVQDVCKAAGLHCQRPMQDALERHRKDADDVLQYSWLDDMQKFLRQLPEAGCSSR
jgi:hypothetical protein